MTKKDLDNRSNQLNPMADAYRQSRQTTMTEKDVARVQQVECKTHGHQLKNGLGAQAQSILNKNNN